jgi:hypothetical protein
MVNLTKCSTMLTTLMYTKNRIEKRINMDKLKIQTSAYSTQDATKTLCLLLSEIGMLRIGERTLFKFLKN